MISEEPKEGPESTDVEAKIAKAYEKMISRWNCGKEKERKGQAHWTPKVNDKVLVRTQPVSDATAGITDKFLHPYEGTYVISKIIPPSTLELAEENAQVRGQFNKRLLKAYKEATRGEERVTGRPVVA